eukprot:evm.model.scf_3971.2 EVM.evm.TU.scf_3971.2   scf_3971:7666-7848(+)
MAARPRGVGSLSGPGAWLDSIPPVTKALGVVWFGTACAYEFGLVKLDAIHLSWRHLWQHLE